METVTPSENPVTTHNRALCTEVMKATKTQSRYPRVSDQVECLALETQKLKKFGYNPSLNAKGWLVYRFHRGFPSTKLAIAQLGDNGKVLSNRELVIAGGVVSEDDPKLWTHDGDDYISWIESHWMERGVPNSCVVKRAKFNGTQITDIVQDTLPGNDGTTWQKNWIYFSHDGRLYALTQCHPTQKIYDISSLKTYSTFNEMRGYETPGPRWPYGEIRGDTAPLPYEGKLLRFFHSRLGNEPSRPNFRYYIGACLHSAEPPFEVERVSRRPIIYASEICGVKPSERPYHYKPNVVFGGSAIETKGGFLLPLGLNDTECVITKIEPSQLNF